MNSPMFYPLIFILGYFSFATAISSLFFYIDLKYKKEDKNKKTLFKKHEIVLENIKERFHKDKCPELLKLIRYETEKEDYIMFTSLTKRIVVNYPLLKYYDKDSADIKQSFINDCYIRRGESFLGNTFSEYSEKYRKCYFDRLYNTINNIHKNYTVNYKTVDMMLEALKKQIFICDLESSGENKIGLFTILNDIKSSFVKMAEKSIKNDIDLVDKSIDILKSYNKLSEKMSLKI